MRHITTTVIAVMLQVASPAQEERPSIHFASGSATLNEDAVAILSQLCDRAGGQTPSMIIISGHTDAVGSDAYNRDLSQRRAEAVRKHLAGRCPVFAATGIEWKGESKPIADNTNGSGRAENRRVEITLRNGAEPTTADGAADHPDTPGYTNTTHEHPKVEQLLPVADKARESHRADASAPIDIIARDGTRIHIAAEAMVDEQGKPVNGVVDISYRSFNEPYEIIASGIPMHVRTDEGIGHMETAGMYEIYASQNGRPVHLKEGERINLERPGDVAPDESFTGWKLDATTGAWAAAGTIVRPPSVVVSATLPMGLTTTRAVAAYWNEIERLSRQAKPDTTLFDARRASGNYCHLTPCDTTAPRKVGWVQRRDRYDETAGVPRITVVGYKGMYEPDNILFAIRIGNDRQFPEWRRLPYDVAWGYIGPHSKTVFKRLYGKHHVYQDIDLVMDPGNEEGVLRLKENGDWLELRVSAALNRNTPGRRARWDSAVDSYTKALGKQRLNFDRDITRHHKRYMREHINEHLQAWRKAAKDMSVEEKAIASDKWREYAFPRRPRPMIWRTGDPEAEAALAKVRTTFDLDDFGIYNIDRIMKMADQQNVLAATADEEGKPFPWVMAYAVLNSERSVITYWGDGRGLEDNMLVSPGKMKSLFLVDDEGNVATASTVPLNSSEPRAMLEVKRLDKSTDIEALRATASK